MNTIFYNKEVNYLTKSNISLQHTNNCEKDNELLNNELIRNNNPLNGWTSEIITYDNKTDNKPIIAKKYYNKKIDDNILIENFNNEVNSLIIMKGEQRIPKIYGINTNELSITMEYCGVPLTEENCPKNWKQQLIKIYKVLQKYNIYHNDVHIANLCVKNKIIYLIDFGLAKQHIEWQYQNFSMEIINNATNILEVFEKIRNNGIEIRKCMYCDDGMKNI